MKQIYKHSVLLVFAASIIFCNAQSNTNNPFNLKIISDTSTYYKIVKADSSQKLVDIKKLCPEITLDIRYATTNNFTHKQMYDKPMAYLRLKPARAIENIQKELNEKGIALKIMDAYRPYSVTLKFWDLIKDSTYVASPKSGSRHNRGCAVDVTLIDLKTGKELIMPTEFDDFTAKAGAYYDSIPEPAKKNRKLLQDIMVKNGFEIYNGEWWHFDFNGWKSYELMDLNFDMLKR